MLINKIRLPWYCSWVPIIIINILFLCAPFVCLKVLGLVLLIIRMCKLSNFIIDDTKEMREIIIMESLVVNIIGIIVCSVGIFQGMIFSESKDDISGEEKIMLCLAIGVFMIVGVLLIYSGEYLKKCVIKNRLYRQSIINEKITSLDELVLKYDIEYGRLIKDIDKLIKSRVLVNVRVDENNHRLILENRI